MNAPQTHFNGTEDEAEALKIVLARNCTCEREKATERLLKRCAACQMVLTDQRALDGLVFCRRKAQRWRDEEGI